MSEDIDSDNFEAAIEALDIRFLVARTIVDELIEGITAIAEGVENCVPELRELEI